MTSVNGIGVKVKNSSPAGLRRWNWRTEKVSVFEVDPDRILTHPERRAKEFSGFWIVFVSMILPQVHLRKPCYDFSFL